jgi:hypothetical protein
LAEHVGGVTFVSQKANSLLSKRTHSRSDSHPFTVQAPEVHTEKMGHWESCVHLGTQPLLKQVWFAPQSESCTHRTQVPLLQCWPKHCTSVVQVIFATQ